MATIKDKAKAYEPKKTKTIAELDVVSTDLKVTEELRKEGTEDEFEMQITKVDGIEYRVPDSVLKSLKAILKEKPDLKTFKVSKSGDGLSTSYTVIPLE